MESESQRSAQKPISTLGQILKVVNIEDQREIREGLAHLIDSTEGFRCVGKSAAVELKVTVHAISFHMHRIHEKLQVHSKSEAVAKALHNRLVS